MFTIPAILSIALDAAVLVTYYRNDLLFGADHRTRPLDELLDLSLSTFDVAVLAALRILFLFPYIWSCLHRLRLVYSFIPWTWLVFNMGVSAARLVFLLTNLVAFDAQYVMVGMSMASVVLQTACFEHLRSSAPREKRIFLASTSVVNRPDVSARLLDHQQQQQGSSGGGVSSSGGGGGRGELYDGHQEDVDFIEFITSKMKQAKKYWTDKTEALREYINDLSQSKDEQSSPFNLLLRLFKYDDVLGELDEAFAHDPTSIEFYIPQLVTFLLYGAFWSSASLQAFLLDKCARSVHFAHRLYWFLNASCLSGSGINPEGLGQVRGLMEEVVVKGQLAAKLLDEGRTPQEELLLLQQQQQQSQQQQQQQQQQHQYLGKDGSTTPTSTAHTCIEVGSLNSDVPPPPPPGGGGDGNDEVEQRLSTASTASRSSSSSSRLGSGASLSSRFPLELGHYRGADGDYFHVLPRFIDSLVSISRSLLAVPRDQRTTALRQRLKELGRTYLPSNVIYMPVGNVYHRVWKVHVVESSAFSTRERVPCLICFEVVDFLQPPAREATKRRWWSMVDSMPNLSSAFRLGNKDWAPFKLGEAAGGGGGHSSSAATTSSSGKSPVAKKDEEQQQEEEEKLLVLSSPRGKNITAATTMSSDSHHKQPLLSSAPSPSFLLPTVSRLDSNDAEFVVDDSGATGSSSSAALLLLPSGGVDVGAGYAASGRQRSESLPVELGSMGQWASGSIATSGSTAGGSLEHQQQQDEAPYQMLARLEDGTGTAVPPSLTGWAAAASEGGGPPYDSSSSSLLIAASSSDSSRAPLLESKEAAIAGSRKNLGAAAPPPQLGVAFAATTTIAHPQQQSWPSSEDSRKKAEGGVAIKQEYRGANEAPTSSSATAMITSSSSSSYAAPPPTTYHVQVQQQDEDNYGTFSPHPSPSSYSELQDGPPTEDDDEAAGSDGGGGGLLVPRGGPGDEEDQATTAAATSSSQRRRQPQHHQLEPLTSGGLPSAGGPSPPVIFKERWRQKEARIRRKSEIGHLPGWRLVPVIVKSDDDLRQEQFASQLLRQIDNIVREAGVPVWLRPYDIIATSLDGGLLEAIPDTVSLDALRKNDARYTTLLDFFHRLFGSSKGGGGSRRLNKARQCFVESMAAYSIICFLLQIKDRHNGNILLDAQGHIIHIDFGFMLAKSPGNVNFEKAPFKLTSEFVELMEGPRSPLFKRFRELCVKTYMELRRQRHKIILLVEMVASGNENLPCFAGNPQAAVEALRQRFQPESNDRACIEYVNTLIDQSLDNWRTRWYDRYQSCFVGIA